MVFRGLPIRASMPPPLAEARKEEKTKKTRVRKCVFFVVCAYGPLCHTCERQERRKKRKKHVLESVFFSWFAHTGLYVTPVRGKKGGKNEKTTLSKTWFFRGLPIRASRSPLWRAREEHLHHTVFHLKTFTSEIFLGQKPPTPGAFSDQEPCIQS